MGAHDVTPTLSRHARQRCVEMGIPTRVAKRILQDADMTRPAVPGSPRRIACCKAYPDYLVVYVDPEHNLFDASVACILTIGFKVDGDYIREGTTYRRIEDVA